LIVHVTDLVVLTLPTAALITMPPVKQKVHINVDLGEGYGNFKCGPDDELIPLIDHANVSDMLLV